MIIYKFEKGEIRTGMKTGLETDKETFKSAYGDFLELYNDGKHTKEELEPVYAFVKTIKGDCGESYDDNEYELILTKDETLYANFRENT